MKARRAIFENPDKDYSTRIVYERVGEKQLIIPVTDPNGGSEMVERLELSRRNWSLPLAGLNVTDLGIGTLAKRFPPPPGVRTAFRG